MITMTTVKSSAVIGGIKIVSRFPQNVPTCVNLFVPCRQFLDKISATPLTWRHPKLNYVVTCDTGWAGVSDQTGGFCRITVIIVPR